MKNGFLKWFSIGTFGFVNVSCSLSGAPVAPQKPSPIPIVYSSKYKISVFGMEKLHPFDIAKYDKIYKGLKKDGYVSKASVIDPAEVTREQMLLIHTEDYIESLKKTKNVARYLEAPQLSIIPNSLLDKMIVSRFRRASGGTEFQGGRGLSTGRGPEPGGGRILSVRPPGKSRCRTGPAVS